MYQDKIVLCGANSYEEKFYMTSAEGDPMFDEIGSRLKIKEIQTDEKKQELLTQLQLYYKVFFLGEEIE